MRTKDNNKWGIMHFGINMSSDITNKLSNQRSKKEIKECRKYILKLICKTRSKKSKK